jgi:hypothetical protein
MVCRIGCIGRQTDSQKVAQGLSDMRTFLFLVALLFYLEKLQAVHADFIRSRSQLSVKIKIVKIG